MDYKTWKLKIKHNTNTFQIPSAFHVGDPDMIPLRREIEMRNFVDKALKGVCLDKMIPKGISRIRMAVLNDVDRAIKDKSIHFTRFEIVAILNVFYSLLDYQVRNMNKSEFKDFLYLTLGITNMTVLSGLCRAARKISQSGNSKEEGLLDGPTFVKMMSILLRGTIEERALLSFHILDEDGDGILSPKSDLSMSLMGTFNPHISASAPNIDPEEPSRDTLRYLIRKMDITTDSGIGIDGFIKECRTSPWLIDGILPTLPSEVFNYAFQNLVSQAPRLPAIENNREEPRKVTKKKTPKHLH